MVGGDEKNVVLLLARLVDLPNGLVGGLHSLESSLVDTSVANHVGWCKVVHDEWVLLLLDSLGNLLCDASGAHLWGKIVRGDGLVGGDEILGLVTLLEREDLLDTTVEEEGDVGVLLGLGNVDLLDALGTKGLSENITHVLGLESNGEWVVKLVLGHSREPDVLWVCEVRLWRTVDVAEELGDFADTIGAVVEEEDLVVVLDAALLATDNDGLQELIVLILAVSLLDSCDGVAAVLALSENHTLEGNLDSVPALVTVHGVVAANDGGNLSDADFLGLVEKLLHVAGAGLGVGIASIAEEMDVDVGNANLLGHLEEGVKVVLLGVLGII